MSNKKSIVETMIVNARTHLLDTSFNNRMINSKITLNKGLSFSVENLNSFYNMVIKNQPFSFLPLESKKQENKKTNVSLNQDANKNIEKVGSTNTVCILESTKKPSITNVRFTIDEGESKLVYSNPKEKDNVALVEDIYSHIKKHFTKYAILQDNIYNKNILFKGFNKSIKEDLPSSKLSIYLSIVSLLRNEGIPKNYLFLGDFNVKYELLAVKEIVQKLEFALEKGFKTVFIPKRNKRDLKNVPSELLNSLEIIYISNIDEAILAVFEMINTVDETNGDGEFIVSKNASPQKIFYVNYNNEDLKSRTEKIYSNSKRHIEEQGINILFLSLGFVQWKNILNENEIVNSPLVFIPVTIEPSNYKNVYKLAYSNSEILLNKSLSKKLELEYNIDFSSIPLEIEDEVEFDVLDYLGKFHEIMLSSGHDFGIDYHSVHLSFYSYNKFLMYNDLDPQNWQEAFTGEKSNVLSDIFLNNIYHEVSNVDDDKNIDHSNEIEGIKNVVDADSSQLLAISKVNRGNSIIIQGPPGTGKSQSIVNIIAESIRQNKKVLFMSEKLAAMDVVYNRLKMINLNHIALQLHSDKVSKSQVVKEIQSIYYMNKLNIKNKDPEITSKLATLREEINHYYELLSVNAIHSKNNLIETYKEIIELENHFDQYQVKHYELEIPNTYLMTLNDYEYGSLSNDLESLESFYNKYGDLKSNPLNSITSSNTITHHELIRYQNIFQTVIDHLTVLSKDVSFPKIAGLKNGNVTLNQLNELHKLDKEDETLGRYLKSVKFNKLIENKEYLDGLMDHFEETLKVAPQAKEDVIHSTDFIDELDNLLQELKSELQYFISNNGFMKQNKRAFKDHKVKVVSKFFKDQQVKNDELLEGLKWLYSNVYFKLELLKEDTLLESIFGKEYKKDKQDFNTIHEIYNSLFGLYDSLCGILSKSVQPSHQLFEYYKKLSQKHFDFTTIHDQIEQLNDRLIFDNNTLFEELDYRNVSLQTLIQQYTKIKESLDNANDITMMKTVKTNLESNIEDEYLQNIIKNECYGNHISKVFNYIRHHSIVKEILENNQELDSFNAMIFDQKIREFIYLDSKNIQMNHLQDTLDAHFYNVYNIRKDETLSVEKKDQKISYLLQTFNKKHNIPTVKQLLKNAFEPITELKPVFMMSPISISQYLDPIVGMFDVVIFDEASQIKPQDAFGALLRGKQVVVVGDEKQLPPTNFFESFYGSTEIFSEDAISNYESILTLLRGSGVPLTTLNWHYRSKHHNLITISNEHFYEHSLRIFPSKYKNNPDYGLKYEYVNGVFDRGRSRTNSIEAKKVAEAVIQHAKTTPHLSLGVATLNINQRDLILSEIKKLRKGLDEVADFFSEEHDEPFFVKNLENVQGDEREVIFVSVGYSKDQNGNIIQNFGAINHLGGERRLNVLMTRARQKCIIYTGLKSSDLEVDFNTVEGVKVLKKYLDFAEKNNDSESTTVTSETKIFAVEIAEVLHKHGYEVSYNVGNPQYFIDLAIINPSNPTEYILGIEFDNSSYKQSRTASERERIRNSVMRAKGWMIYKVYITSWFNNRQQVIDSILEFLNEIESTPPLEENINIELEEEPVNVVTRFGFDPYQIYNKRIENFNFLTKDSDQFEVYVKDLLYVEAPIKLQSIINRIVENSHITIKPKAVKSKLKRALRRLEKEHTIYENEGFYYYYGKEKSLKFRDRRSFGTEVDVLNVSQDEFIYAITEIAGNSFGIDTKNITSIISNYLGYSLNNSQVLEIVERLSIRLVNTKVLFRDNNNNLQKNK